MLIFNCTKDASDFFSFKQKGKIVTPITDAPNIKIDDDLSLPIDINNSEKKWQWLVHLVKVNRKNVLILIDHKTRFSIVLTGIKKGDARAFLNGFELHLNILIHIILVESNIDHDFINDCLNNYYRAHQTNAFYSREDISSQPQIDELSFHFKETVKEYGEILKDEELIGFNIDISKFESSRKDLFSPDEKMLKFWLNEFSSLRDDEIELFSTLYKDLKNAQGVIKYDIEMNLQGDISNENLSLEDEKNNSLNNVINLNDFRKK